MEKGKLDDIIQSSISQTVKISEDDTKKNAETVKLSILSDIQHMIDLKTQPLIEKINVLEKVNRQLTNDLDNLEQYGRISLLRISGIPEPVGEVDTTETVRNLISEIDPEYKPLKFRDFLRFLRDLKILIFTLGSARRTIICLVLLFKEPGSEILPTLFDLMTSVGLYSGSISDIKLRTVFVVSTSPTGSGIPDMRIRLILPYCSRLSRSFVSCRLTFSRTLTFSMRG
jgi:hypothetical protein